MSNKDILTSLFKGYELKVKQRLLKISTSTGMNILTVVSHFELYKEGMTSCDTIEQQLEVCNRLETWALKNGVFKPGYWADEILVDNTIVTPKASIPAFYNGKTYVIDSSFIELTKIIREMIGVTATKANVREVIASLASKTYNDAIKTYDPTNKYICVRDGLINLDNGNLIDHDSSKHTFGILDIQFKTETDDTEWRKYLKQLIPDKEIVRFNQSLGDLLNPNYVSKKASWWFGNTDSGKSTLASNIISFLGEENCSSLKLDQLGDNRLNSSLLGKKANIYVEDDLELSLKNISRFKSFTGEDRIETMVLYSQENLRFYNTAKIIFGGNSTPVVKHLDVKEFYNRWNPFEFYNVFPRNEAIKNKFKTEEMRSTILKFLVIENIMFRTSGYCFHDELGWTEIRDFFRSNSYESKHTDGFREWATVRLKKDKDSYVFAYEIYYDSREWCDDNKLMGYPSTEPNVGKKMEKIRNKFDYDVISPMSKAYKKQKTAYKGIKLLVDGTEKWKHKKKGLR